MQRFKTSIALKEALTLDNSNRVLNVLNDDLNNINYNIDVLSVLIYNFKSIDYNKRCLALDYIYKLLNSADDNKEFNLSDKDKKELTNKINEYKIKNSIFNNKLSELKEVLNQV